MKKLTNLLLASALLFSACESKNPIDNPGGEPNLEVSPELIEIDASVDVASRELTVEATGEWEITSTPEWITTKNVTETGFTIEVAPYLDGETETREGEIVVTMGDLTDEVTVKQQRYVPAGPVLEVTPESIEIIARNEVLSREVTVEASDSWDITGTPDWITTKDVTETGFFIDIQPYIDGDEDTREGVVTVEMGDLKREITVTQHTYLIPPVIILTPDEILEAIEGQTYEIAVEASHDWDTSTDFDWITIDRVSGADSFTVSVDDYGSLADPSRSGTVVVTLDDPAETYRTLTVTQNKPEEIIALADYLGSYKVTGEMAYVGYTPSAGWTGLRPYESTGTLADTGDSILAIPVFGIAENMNISTTLRFIYDPVKGSLSNKDWTVGEYTIFAYLNGTTYTRIPEGEIVVKFESGSSELIFPTTYNVEGTEYPIYIVAAYGPSYIPYNEITVTNLKFTKQ